MTTKVSNGLDLQGQRIQGIGDPSVATDAVNLQYLQNFLRGIAFKDPVRAASTGNINLAAPGASIDGVAMNVGDAFLAKDQTTSSERGIYVWNGAGTPATRRNDADSGTELRPGTAVTVTEGTTANADRIFAIISDTPITIGTSGMTWGVVGGGGQTYTGSNGVNVSGSSITGVAAPAGGVVVGATGFAIDTSVVPKKIAGNLGNGSLTVIPVTHNLGTKDVLVSVRLNATDEEWIVDWVATDANTVTFTFGTAPAANAYRFSIHG